MADTSTVLWATGGVAGVAAGELGRLKELVDSWRTRGDKVVFTNGCFDLLHPGHLKLLRDCRSFGDKLIVAVNSDSSVQMLKGANRPIQAQAMRCALLAEMCSVDAVVCFDEPDPGWIVGLLLPDVMVKGADYAGRTIAGSEFCKEVRFVDLVDGVSTSSIVARICKQ